MNTKRTIVQNKYWLLTMIVGAVISLALSGCNYLAAPPRVGILLGVDTFSSTVDGFRSGMTELGYIEDENISYDYQEGNGDREKMAQIAEKFVADEVDLIITVTTGATLVAQKATQGTTIPIIFTVVSAPVEKGVIDDIQRPGGNTTGVRTPTEITIGKRVEYLLAMAPEVQAIWVPYNPNDITVQIAMEQLQSDASALDVELIATPISNPEEVLAEIETLNQNTTLDFEAVLIMPDIIIQRVASWEAILAFAEQRDLIVVANTASQVQQGGLFSYFPDSFQIGEQAAILADRILQGSPIAELPIVGASPHLVINVQTAETLGLVLKREILDQAFAQIGVED